MYLYDYTIDFYFFLNYYFDIVNICLYLQNSLI